MISLEFPQAVYFLVEYIWVLNMSRENIHLISIQHCWVKNWANPL